MSQKLTFLIVPSLFLLQIFLQLFLRHQTALNPWVGGGQAMFAFTDYPDLRSFKLEICSVTSEACRLQALPAHYNDLATKVAFFPRKIWREELNLALQKEFPKNKIRLTLLKKNFNQQTHLLQSIPVTYVTP